MRRAYVPAVRFPHPPRLLTLLPEVKVPFPRSYGAGELRLRLPEPFQLVVGEMPDLEGGPGIAHDLREIELILELKPGEPPGSLQRVRIFATRNTLCSSTAQAWPARERADCSAESASAKPQEPRTSQRPTRKDPPLGPP